MFFCREDILISSKFTFEQKEWIKSELSTTLFNIDKGFNINCTDCEDCTNCANCSNCIDCTNCIKCIGCSSSHNSSNSQYCLECVNCDNCENCQKLFSDKNKKRQINHSVLRRMI